MKYPRLKLFLFGSLWAQPQFSGGYAQCFYSKGKNIAGTYWNDINEAKDGHFVAKLQ